MSISRAKGLNVSKWQHRSISRSSVAVPGPVSLGIQTSFRTTITFCYFPKRQATLSADDFASSKVRCEVTSMQPNCSSSIRIRPTWGTICEIHPANLMLQTYWMIVFTNFLQHRKASSVTKCLRIPTQPDGQFLSFLRKWRHGSAELYCDVT